MKEKLTLLFLCLLVLGLAQNGCQESRLDKIQTGEINLLPNDLGTAGANKNYLESLSRGNFGTTDLLSTAVAIAGFETSCAQTFFSLIVDVVEPQNENTKLKIVIDFRNKAQTGLTSWAKVKLTYLVVSTSRLPPLSINQASLPNSALIWATSQYVNIPTGGQNNAPIFTDPILAKTPAAWTTGAGCGLYYDATLGWRFGIKCDNTASGVTAATVDRDVAVHTYIMGFHYEPDAGSQGTLLAASVKYDGWTDNIDKYEVAFYNDAAGNIDRSFINTDWKASTSFKTAATTKDAYGVPFRYDATVGGPMYDIADQGNELKGIKIAIVFTVINPLSSTTGAPNNGFGAKDFAYSYSGLYSEINPAKYNIKTQIEDDPYTGDNNLHERLPVVKYAIYGFSSFSLIDGSGCTSFSLDLTLNGVNALTFSTNQKSSVSSVVIQSDQYFPQTGGVCSPSVEFQTLQVTALSAAAPQVAAKTFTTGTELAAARAGTRANLKYMKTRVSEKYATVPSSNIEQYIKQINDNPLSLNFVVLNKAGVNEYVQMNAEIVMNGLTAGKSYGIYFLLSPQTSAANWPTLTDGNYQYTVAVNGFKIVQKTFDKTGLDGFITAGTAKTSVFQDWYGINVAGNTATFTFNVTVPRDNSTTATTQNHQLIVDFFEFQSVYDPVTQCCSGACPAQTGVDVSVTPPACVPCDASMGLSYDPATSACKCADSFYISSNMLYQCYPCETKLCATCNPTKPTFCQACIGGASLSNFDNTCACSDGFFENNGTCTKCATRCSTCSVASTCNTCGDVRRDTVNNCSCIAGFYDAGVDKCATCSPSCATCSGATTCTSCEATKFRSLNNTLCVCQEGYFELVFENGTRVCTKCSSECKACSQSATECTGCDVGVNRIEGYDSLGHRTCICKAGYYSVANGGCVQSNCKSDKWCSQCEADLALCIQCQANVNRVIKLPEHICVCADGFFEAADGTCKPCADGCSKCSSATKCDACVPQATNNGDGTCKCASGTFFGVASNGVRYCQQCTQYCDKCGNGLTCQTCKTAFVLSADNTCVCPKNNFINAKGDCVPCKAGCETCFSNTTCDKCQAPLVLQENNCIQKCSAGYFLSGAKCIGCPINCVGCTSTNQCYYCKDGFFLAGGACYTTCPAGTVANRETFQCSTCNKPCKTCVNHPSSCTSCEPGEGYLQITGTDQKCVKECAEGTFPQDGVCQVCDFKCAKCLGAAGNCIACPAGRYLYNAACWDYCPGVVDANGKCVNECPPGYFRQSDQECKTCSSECKTCSNNSTCLTCANNFVSLNGKCVKECGNGYYSFRGQCVACDKSCKTCANNPLQCTSCADNFISSNGRCASSCTSGQYLDVVSRTCRQCASTCATCSSEQNCLTCPNNKILPVGGQCLSCIYPCASCSADLTVCNACQSGFYLSNGDCLRSCPTGTRSVNGVCQCSSGLILDGACVASCPTGFTRVGSGCQRCESPCTECSSSSTFCTDCLDTFVLRPSTGKCEQSSSCNYGQIDVSGKCTRICDAGLYYQNGACIFGGCPSGFKDNGFGGCVSASVSTGRCEQPTFRLNGVCTDNCGSNFFPNTNTRTCDACSTSCQSCLNNNYCLTCATGFTSVEGRCVSQSTCGATQFSYNSGCVSSCPTGTFTSNGRCVRSCPSGSFYFGNVCYDTCPTEARLFTDNACLNACPTGTTLIDNVCATVV